MERPTENGMPTQDNIIFEGISKRYGQGPAIISDFSHSFVAGSATGLLGPNGSGKTTLLRLLSVSSFPSEGTLRYGELDICQHPYAYLKHVGIVHDVSSLPQYMTAFELLEYILRARKKWTESSSDHVNVVLDRLNLDERRHNLIGTYSSGMLKKTQIASAVVANPSILLLDEPFRGLDTESLETTLDLLAEFKSRSSIIVISSHRKDMLDILCDEYINLGAPQSVEKPSPHPNR